MEKTNSDTAELICIEKTCIYIYIYIYMMSFGGRGLPSPGPAKPLALYMGRPAGKIMQPAPRYST